MGTKCLSSWEKHFLASFVQAQSSAQGLGPRELWDQQGHGHVLVSSVGWQCHREGQEAHTVTDRASLQLCFLQEGKATKKGIYE